MFALIQNYKTMFMGFIKNEFAEVKDSAIDSEGFKTDDSVEELKSLKGAINNIREGMNSGLINKAETEQILKNYDIIEEETKVGLKEIMSSMLKEGLSANNEATYNAFSKLLAKNEIILPTWDKITKLVSIDNKRFKGVKIQGNTLQIKYDKFLSVNDTLTLKFDTKTGFETEFLGWSNEEGDIDKINVYNEAKLDKSILDDNISRLEAERVVKTSEIEPVTESDVPVKESDVPVKESEEQLGNLQKEHFMNKPEGERKKIQELLGFKGDDIDGLFGPKTLKAIIDFQKSVGFKGDDIDGKVGPKTIAKLNSKINPNFRKQEQTKPKQEQTEFKQEQTESLKETISETSKKVLDWIEELLFNDINLNTFKGENGKEITIEFDKTKKQFNVDTPFFDGVDDYILGLDIDFRKYKTKEDVKRYLESKKTKIVNEYNKKIENYKNNQEKVFGGEIDEML